MPTINAIQYPDTPEQMQKADSTLVKLFDRFWASMTTANDMAFAKQASKVTAKTAHTAYEMSGLHNGKCLISLSKSDQSKIKALTKRGHLAVDVKKMTAIVRQMHAMVQHHAQTQALGKFYDTSDFQKYHRKVVFDQIKPNKAMAAKFGTSDMGGLRKFQFYLRMGEVAAAQKMADTLIKAEALRARGPEIVRKLVAQNNL